MGGGRRRERGEEGEGKRRGIMPFRHPAKFGHQSFLSDLDHGSPPPGIRVHSLLVQ